MSRAKECDLIVRANLLVARADEVVRQLDELVADMTVALRGPSNA